MVGYRQDTIDFLEDLYSLAVETSETFRAHKYLTVVLLPGKTYMPDAEIENYVKYKALIDTLCLWMEKSTTGLENIKNTYPGVPNFLSLIDKTQRTVAVIKDFLANIDKNFKKMRILSPVEIVEDKEERREERKEERKEEEKKRDQSTSGTQHFWHFWHFQ